MAKKGKLVSHGKTPPMHSRKLSSMSCVFFFLSEEAETLLYSWDKGWTALKTEKETTET